jgi:hypothetical protein
MSPSIRFFSRSLAGLAIATAILAGACTDDSKGSTTGQTPRTGAVATATAGQEAPTPAPAQTSTGDATGIAAVDATMKMVKDRNLDALAGAVQFSEFACAASPQGAGGPPRCDAGETNGQKVKVFPWSGCEVQYAREDSVRDRLKEMVTDRQVTPLALVRLAAGTKLAYFEGERYGVIYEVSGAPGLMIGLTEDGKIKRLYEGCQAPAAELVSRADPSSIIKKFKQAVRLGGVKTRDPVSSLHASPPTGRNGCAAATPAAG